MNESDIKKIREELGKISPWPWSSAWACNNAWYLYGPAVPYEGSDGFLKHDARFISDSPSRIAALLDEVEKCHAKLKLAEDVLEHCFKYPATDKTINKTHDELIEGVCKAQILISQALMKIREA